MMLFYFKFISSAFLIYDFIHQKVSQELINLSYNLIYTYSKIQIYLQNMNKCMNEFINNNTLLYTLKTKLIDFLNGPKKYVEYIKDGYSFDEIIDPYDFIIYNGYNKTNCVDKKIFYKNISNLSDYEVSNVKFILLKAKVNEKCEYNIPLKRDNVNFYIVGNKFTKEFFIYFLNTILNVKNVLITDTISLSIIDNNVNSFDFTFTHKNEYIILEKNDYKLVT